MSVAHVARWFIRRVFYEELFGFAISIVLSVLMTIVQVVNTAKIVLKLLQSGLSTGLISNVALFTGTLTGFLASVVVVTVLSSLLRKDRLSRFIEVALSGPFSCEHYLAGLVTACVILSIIVNVVLTVTSTCTVLARAPTLLYLIVNWYSVVVSLLITLTSSLLVVLIDLILIRAERRIRVGPLSILPSLIIFFIIVLVIRPLSVHTPLWTILYTLIAIAGLCTASLAAAILRIIRPESLIT